MTDTPITMAEPIPGEVLEKKFVDDETLLVRVRDEEGALWTETYKFEIAELDEEPDARVVGDE